MEIPGYRIESTIGEGGMATAYLAIQESLGRLVVLKVLNTASQNNPENVKRFLNEARIIASLNHPHIITIYDIGIAQDFIYMSMEYVEGGDLRMRLKRPIRSEEALDIVSKIGDGLAAAHKKGIIHRDVKPANILFRKNGVVLLSDFGIAKEMTGSRDLTSTGMFLGSPNYMAPEQAEEGHIDGRADLYSLGIILYEMLAGKKPYSSDSILDIIIKHKQAPVPTLSAELQDYQQLVELMLAKQRKDRFRDADSMLHYVHHLEHRLQDRGPSTKPPNAASAKGSKQVSKKARRKGRKRKPEAKHVLFKPKRHLHPILLSLLIVMAIGYGLLSYLEYSISVKTRNLARSTAPNLQAPFLFDNSSRSNNTPVGNHSQANQDVVNALTWLGKQSLEDLRLTSPTKDNASYYFSRLLELDPKNTTARKGLLMVAEKFAYLAERELAEDNYDTAQSYIHLGLKFDPNNRTLQSLKRLAQTEKGSLVGRIVKFLKRS